MGSAFKCVSVGFVCVIQALPSAWCSLPCTPCNRLVGRMSITGKDGEFNGPAQALGLLPTSTLMPHSNDVHTRQQRTPRWRTRGVSSGAGSSTVRRGGCPRARQCSCSNRWTLLLVGRSTCVASMHANLSVRPQGSIRLTVHGGACVRVCLLGRTVTPPHT